MPSDVEISENSRDAVLLALGNLVVHVSSLEEGLHDAIVLLSGGENPAIQILTAGVSFRVLVEKFGALCTDLGTARLPSEDVIGFCNHLMALNDRRNTIIHSAWYLAEESGTHQRYKRRSTIKTGFSMGVTEISAKEIGMLADSFACAVEKLWEFPP